MGGGGGGGGNEAIDCVGTWIPWIEENNEWFMVKVGGDLGPSPQRYGNVGVVLPNGEISRDGDTQPQLRRSLRSTLCLKLPKPVTRAKHRHKGQRHTVGASNLGSEVYLQDKGISPTQEGVHAL